MVKDAFITFDLDLWLEEQLRAPHHNFPRLMYFQKALLDRLTTDLLKIKLFAELQIILTAFSWPFIESQGLKLYVLISLLQANIRSSHHKTAVKKAKKAKQVSDSELELVDMDSLSSPAPPATSKHPRRAKESALTVADSEAESLVDMGTDIGYFWVSEYSSPINIRVSEYLDEIFLKYSTVYPA